MGLKAVIISDEPGRPGVDHVRIFHMGIPDPWRAFPNVSGIYRKLTLVGHTARRNP